MHMTTYSDLITTVERLLDMDSTNQPHYQVCGIRSQRIVQKANLSLFNDMHTLQRPQILQTAYYACKHYSKSSLSCSKL